MTITAKQEKSLRQACENEKHYRKPYESYSRNYKLRPITAKFYSKYEHTAPVAQFTVPIEEINLHISSVPKDRSQWPQTTNQEYGWTSVPLVKIDLNDRRLTKPRRSYNFIKHSLQLQKEKLKEEKFTGIPFLLQ